MFHKIFKTYRSMIVFLRYQATESNIFKVVCFTKQCYNCSVLNNFQRKKFEHPYQIVEVTNILIRHILLFPSYCIWLDDINPSLDHHNINPIHCEQ